MCGLVQSTTTLVVSLRAQTVLGWRKWHKLLTHWLACATSVSVWALKISQHGFFHYITDHCAHVSSSSDDEETRFSDEEALSLYSGGESLRLSTRNFPQRTAAWNDCDDPAETKIDTDNLTTGEISDLYTVVGKTLSSPQVWLQRHCSLIPPCK